MNDEKLRDLQTLIEKDGSIFVEEMSGAIFSFIKRERFTAPLKSLVSDLMRTKFVERVATLRYLEEISEDEFEYIKRHFQEFVETVWGDEKEYTFKED